MQLKHTLPLALALANRASGQTDNPLVPLGTALASRSDLTSLLDIRRTQPTFLAQLALAQNVTFLAPNNDAMNSFLNGPNAAPANATDPVAVSALLSLYVLNGTFYDADFSRSPQFVSTALNLAPYSNITGGQRVQIWRAENSGNATVYSGLKESSMVVMAPNLNFTGGTIHVADRVLTLPLNDTQTLIKSNLTAAAGALRRADIRGVASGMRGVTILAPTNEAFNRISSLKSNLSTEQLATIMRYHVAQGQLPLYSNRILNTTMASLQGGNLTFSNVSGVFYVNSGRVINANILTSNGVIHVIHNVLNPQNTTLTANPEATVAPPAFGGATTGIAGVPFTSGVAAPQTTPTSGPSNGGGDNNGGSGNDNNNKNNNSNNGGAGASSSRGAAAPMKTGVVAAAALFDGADLID